MLDAIAGQLDTSDKQESVNLVKAFARTREVEDYSQSPFIGMMIDCIREGCLHLVLHLLDMGLDARMKLTDEMSLLHLAAKHGHAQVYKLLEERGAAAAEDEHGKTPMDYGLDKFQEELLGQYIHNLILRGDVAQLEAWLAKNQGIVSSILYEMIDDMSSLHRAVISENAKMVNIVMGQIDFWKINLARKKDKNGATPLMLAVRRGFTRGVELLLSREKSIYGYEVNFLKLLPMGCHEMVSLFLILMDEHKYDRRFKIEALCSAAQNGHVKVVKLFKADRELINSRNNCGYGKTALESTAEYGHEKVVDELLLWGADSKAVDEKGWTALHAACKNKHRKIVKKLLTNGVDCEALYKGGQV